MPDYTVHTGTVDSVTDDLAQATLRVGAIVAHLNDQIEPLKSQWLGENPQTYQAVQNAWNAKVEDMRTVLTKAQQALVEIRANYSGTDAKLSFQWSEIR
ncbi:WXG100 family type VII secretion target [Actinomadura rupiterrae]|uniref:WXG100 family type VII secretion target n=1 Tax=Actinomadura rupiterrae TaxID=559627 RepID=UPI0020A40DCF|nr:WXG100 family type VII secretion target [Actinomadura rupiterrae]MCP2336728.1 WXG100 family type VII secretion target [Actinomadura rupiterrae]